MISSFLLLSVFPSTSISDILSDPIIFASPLSVCLISHLGVRVVGSPFAFNFMLLDFSMVFGPVMFSEKFCTCSTKRCCICFIWPL